MLHRQSSEIETAENGAISVQLAKYGDIREVSDDGRTVYRETFTSMRMADKVHVKDAHDGQVIGHADPDTFRESPDPTIDIRVAQTSAGRDLLALVRNGTINDVSVEFNPGPEDTEVDGVMVRDGATVGGIAFAFRPAHDAPILTTVREDTTPKETIMADATDTIVAADVVTPEDLAAFGDELKREMVNFRTVDTAEVSPLAQFRSLGEVTKALLEREGPEAQALQRALADQITGDNAGTLRPKYINEIKGTVDFGRPTITAFGTVAIEQGQGMTIEWPVNANDEATLVGNQATEKTAVSSVTWSVTNETASLLSYAGASDISYQLLRRSTPSYLDAYAQAMYRGYAITSDSAAATQAVAASTASTALWVPATGTAADLRTALFTASTEVENATNMPATFVLVASDVWAAIGGLELMPPMYGTQNVAGTAAASTLRVEVSGLPIIHDRFLADGTILVSNSRPAPGRKTAQSRCRRKTSRRWAATSACSAWESSRRTSRPASGRSTQPDHALTEDGRRHTRTMARGMATCCH